MYDRVVGALNLADRKLSIDEDERYMLLRDDIIITPAKILQFLLFLQPLSAEGTHENCCQKGEEKNFPKKYQCHKSTRTSEVFLVELIYPSDIL